MTELTDSLWARFGTLSPADLPDDVRTVANHCILDWFGCAVGGSAEPLALILQDEFTAGSGACTIVGTRRRGDVFRAALVNGAAGHALDFDDTSPLMGGHASVPLLPAVLAVAEAQGRSVADAVTAFVVGLEVQARIGMSIGTEHYGKGWHTTSTMGVFGAAAATCWLLGLDADGFGTAMGVAASNASGVKANFGTMTKPLHPGQAAERGVMAARLAARGFTANAAAVDGNQSLAQAAGSGSLDYQRIQQWSDRWATPRTLFKFHAACHLTHAGIEATTEVLRRIGVGPDNTDDVQQVTLTVNPSILDVCGIPNPSNGLEAKFSLRGTQALLLNGVNTASSAAFGDEPINRPAVQSTIDRVVVQTDTALPQLATRVSVRSGGAEHDAHVDMGQPATDLDLQGHKLRAKFDALVQPILGDTGAATLGDLLSNPAAVDHITTLTEATVLAGSTPTSGAHTS